MIRKNRGFSIINLLLVIAFAFIISITVFYPSIHVKRQGNRIKELERERGMLENLVEIKGCLHKYKDFYGYYPVCPKTPEKLPGKKAVSWPREEKALKVWEEIMFKPPGKRKKVWYQYEVTRGPLDDPYKIWARRDPDGDGIPDETWVLQEWTWVPKQDSPK